MSCRIVSIVVPSHSPPRPLLPQTYCAQDPDNDPTKGYTGIDVLLVSEGSRRSDTVGHLLSGAGGEWWTQSLEV